MLRTEVPGDLDNTGDGQRREVLDPLRGQLDVFRARGGKAGFVGPTTGTVTEDEPDPTSVETIVVVG